METVNYGRNKFYDTGPWLVFENMIVLLLLLTIYYTVGFYKINKNQFILP
jgi:hypothetical protein